jgi:hypothetical protein
MMRVMDTISDKPDWTRKVIHYLNYLSHDEV